MLNVYKNTLSFGPVPCLKQGFEWSKAAGCSVEGGAGRGSLQAPYLPWQGQMQPAVPRGDSHQGHAYVLRLALLAWAEMNTEGGNAALWGKEKMGQSGSGPGALSSAAHMVVAYQNITGDYLFIHYIIYYIHYIYI